MAWKSVLHVHAVTCMHLAPKHVGPCIRKLHNAFCVHVPTAEVVMLHTQLVLCLMPLYDLSGYSSEMSCAVL